MKKPTTKGADAPAPADADGKSGGEPPHSIKTGTDAPPPTRAQLLTQLGRLEEDIEVERQQLEAEESALIESQQQLETSRERYVELYDFAPVGYLTLDRNGCVLESNFTAGALLGVERTKLIGHTLAFYVPVEDRRGLQEHLWRARRTELPVSSEVRFQKAAGGEFVAQMVSVRGRDTGSGALQLRVSLTDITERRRAEDSLRQSEARFRTMADSAPVMIWITGPDQRPTWFNRPWLEFVGHTIEQELSAGWGANVHLDDLPRCLQTFSQAFAARKDFRLEYRLRRHDGQWRWVLDCGVPLRQASKDFSGYIGSSVDITERKLAEEQLLAKQAELDLITSKTPVMLAHCSRDLRYKFVNHAYAKMLGLSPKQIIGKPVREVLGESVWQVIRPRVEQVLEGRSVEYEAEVPYPGPGPRIIHAAYMPETDGLGGVTGWVAALSDITERRREEQRRQVRDNVTRELAEAGSLAAAAARILQTLCQPTTWDAAALWLVDAGNRVLHCVEYWRRQDGAVSFFETVTRGRQFARGQDLVGQVWTTAQPLFVEDLSKSPHFARASSALKDGLLSGFYFPILLEDRVLGVIECYSLRRHKRDPGFVKLVADVADKMGQYIKREQAEEALRQNEEHLRRILQTALDAVITIDVSGIITFWNAQAEKIFGWSQADAVGRALGETVIPARHRSAYEERLRRYREAGDGLQIEKRLELTALHRSGQEFPVEISIAPLLHDARLSFCAFVRDITQRKAAEEVLRRGREELEQRVRERTAELSHANEKLKEAFSLMNDLYHHAPCGYHSVDAAGRFVEINATALRWLGYSREDLVGKKTIFDLESPASRPRGLVAFNHLKQGIPVQDLQVDLIRKDGTPLTVLLNATALMDAAGKLVQTRSAYVDVSSRMRAEQALAHSEARLQAILDFSPVIMFVKDLQGRYQLVNREFERSLGLKQHKVIGRTDAELLARDVAAVFRAHDRAVLRTGLPRTFEETAPFIDGNRVWVVVKFPMRDNRGHVIALGGMAMDITDRKQAEAALQASETKFRGFVESAPDAVVIVDPEGRIQLINAKTEHMFGYKREELLGQSVERLMPRRYHDFHLEHHAGYFAAPRNRPMGGNNPLFGRRKDGFEFPVEISLSPLDTPSGKLACAAIRDITARRRIEDELRKSKEHYLALFKKAQTAQRALQKLSRLALHAQEKERHRISRELHDDVGQSLTAVSLTLKGVQFNGTAEFASDRHKLDEARRHLQTTMETIHNFARELRPSVLDELGLIPALRSALRGTAGLAGLRVTLRADPLAEKLGGEEKLVLFRVAQECLNNVVKHAQASHVRMTLAKANGGILLRVADNGKSFQPDQRDSVKGQRLGILGMKERVRLVNGTFQIQGRPGKGTTVQVKVPLKTARAPSKEKAP